ncbi:hypothetical protein HaLaN_02515 [Haematococcus lacustris]|uniref:Uncharacterized protein n=1 Tax=Haematococcus lacustris TaxID=44745 RepID=A0A699YXD4_HAELA|nr:hypothetical protein HaLaN_02515 [Haematococcus lacustris]
MSVLLPATSVQFLNLTLANLPVGPSVYTPLNLFTSLAFIVAFNREAMGLSGVRLLLQDVTLLLPADEMVWWRAMAADPSLAVDWATQLPVFLVTEASNGSVSVQHLRSVRGSFVWRNTQLVSVQQRQPSTPLLLHDTGVLRLNGLGPPVFSFSMVRNVPSVIDMFLLPRSWKVPRNRLIVSLMDSGSAYLPNFTTLLNDTVITGYVFQPQAFMLDLAAALTRLSPRGAGGQLTLSNLVLGNAAPLLSSLVCGAAARQQGVACTSASLGNTTDPEASSRAVWRATGLAELGAEGPLPPLCSPALAAALGGLTSLLWFFYTPRSHPLDDQPTLAAAPLLLLNVTVLLPDLEVQAIREVAASGGTQVNLRHDTLDLLRAQLAGQRVRLGKG